MYGTMYELYTVANSTTTENKQELSEDNAACWKGLVR